MSGPSSSSAPNQKNQPTFEFTKRKRFADLLITELVGTINLVLSSDCKILFCGAAVTDLLGWRDEDLVDGDLIELINEDDRTSFRNSFEESLRTRNELFCHVRLKCKSQFSTAKDFDSMPEEVLLEFKGYPHFIPGEENCKCFFAVAAPYPSRNTAMLNTFLDLKMENERLQQRVADLRERAHNASSAPATYVNTMMQPPYSPTQAGEQYYDMHVNSGMTSELVGATFDGAGSSSHKSTYSWNPVIEDKISEDSTRKKLKRSHIVDRHVCVTCGRTDSPEWRKGPQGPKTLCNACGLRWAKYQRKGDDSNDTASAGGEVSQGRARGSSSKSPP